MNVRGDFMINLKQKEDELFQEWKEKRGYQYFIKDGVFNEPVWVQENRKILFVLKEANWENDNEDLCEWLLSETSPTYWKTWNNIARWAKALLEGGEYPAKVSKSDKTYWLKRVAFLNLKKVGGNAVAENETIRAYAISDASFIKRQILLYKPDIIICCGRGNGKNADLLYEEILKDNWRSEWKATIYGYNYFYTELESDRRIPIVSFYHPQMRGSHELFKKRYEEMIEIGNLLHGMDSYLSTNF